MCCLARLIVRIIAIVIGFFGTVAGPSSQDGETMPIQLWECSDAATQSFPNPSGLEDLVKPLGSL